MLDVDLVRTDGTRLPVRLIHRVPVAPDGTIGASRTLVLDMRRRDDREAGRIAEMRFARFFNSTPMAIASIDREGRIALTNARFVMLFGKKGAAGRPLAELVQESARAGLAAAISAAISGQSEIPAVDAALAEHENRSARFFVSPILEGDESEDAAVIYALETTDQRALEQQFAQSQKMQAVGQLAGGIAHDFNNMLTAIIGFSDLLLTTHRPTDPSFQDIMNIKQNANRAAGLVRQLLAFSRRQTLRPKVIELDEALSDISVLLGRLLGETITLEVGHGRDVWPIKADLNQLEQVIVNLAVNARDAMPDGGKLTIRTANVSAAESAKYREQGFKPGDYVLLEVADTGMGMTPEVKEKIFEPFFTTKGVGEGTGLGLSTVYGIVKQTGGFIYVDSKVGKGHDLPHPPAAPRADAGRSTEAEGESFRPRRSDRQRAHPACGGRGGRAGLRRPSAFGARLHRLPGGLGAGGARPDGRPRRADRPRHLRRRHARHGRADPDARASPPPARPQDHLCLRLCRGRLRAASRKGREELPVPAQALLSEGVGDDRERDARSKRLAWRTRLRPHL